MHTSNLIYCYIACNDRWNELKEHDWKFPYQYIDGMLRTDYEAIKGTTPMVNNHWARGTTCSHTFPDFLLNNYRLNLCMIFSASLAGSHLFLVDFSGRRLLLFHNALSFFLILFIKMHTRRISLHYCWNNSPYSFSPPLFFMFSFNHLFFGTKIDNTVGHIVNLISYKISCISFCKFQILIDILIFTLIAWFRYNIPVGVIFFLWRWINRIRDRRLFFWYNLCDFLIFFYNFSVNLIEFNLIISIYSMETLVLHKRSCSISRLIFIWVYISLFLCFI